MLQLSFRLAIGAALLSALLASTPADASILVALDLQELAAESDRIAVGHVVFIEPVRLASGTIRTRCRILVEQELRGSDDSEIIVETLGGQIGTLGMRVAGAASLALGDRVVVFAKGDGGVTFRPVGMAQGVMRIKREHGRDVVSPSSAGALLVRSDERGRMVKSAGPLSNPEPLDRFLSRVREIVQVEQGDVR
jgi:hypothetical protein